MAKEGSIVIKAVGLRLSSGWRSWVLGVCFLEGEIISLGLHSPEFHDRVVKKVKQYNMNRTSRSTN